MTQRFKIYETVYGVGPKGRWTAFAEMIGSYPDFKSVEEGLAYIRKVLDPYYTGKYGIVDTNKNQ